MEVASQLLPLSAGRGLVGPRSCYLLYKAPASPGQCLAAPIPAHPTPPAPSLRIMQLGGTVSFNRLLYWVLGFCVVCLAKGLSWSHGDCVPSSEGEKLAPHKAYNRMGFIDCSS